VVVDVDQMIEVNGCVNVQEGGRIVIVIEESVDLLSLENSPLLVFDVDCGEVEVEIEYFGNELKCPEAIEARNEQVSNGKR